LSASLALKMFKRVFYFHTAPFICLAISFATNGFFHALIHSYLSPTSCLKRRYHCRRSAAKYAMTGAFTVVTPEKMRALCSIHEAYWERSGGCYILDLIHIHDNTLDYCVNDVHEVSDSRHYSTFNHHHASHCQEIPRSYLVLFAS
jgi:hypothetical protein